MESSLSSLKALFPPSTHQPILSCRATQSIPWGFNHREPRDVAGDRSSLPSDLLHSILWGHPSHPDPDPFWGPLIPPACQRKGGMLVARKQAGLEGTTLCLSPHTGARKGGTVPSRWLRAGPGSSVGHTTGPTGCAAIASGPAAA